MAALVLHRHLPVKELLQRILDEIADFRGKTPQSDDITLILLKVENPKDVPDSLA